MEESQTIPFSRSTIPGLLLYIHVRKHLQVLHIEVCPSKNIQGLGLNYNMVLKICMGIYREKLIFFFQEEQGDN